MDQRLRDLERRARTCPTARAQYHRALCRLQGCQNFCIKSVDFYECHESLETVLVIRLIPTGRIDIRIPLRVLRDAVHPFDEVKFQIALAAKKIDVCPRCDEQKENKNFNRYYKRIVLLIETRRITNGYFVS